MKAKCPYCGRKITYGTRFMEKEMGEHMCKNCKKPSNIVQDSKIWVIFTISVIFALALLLFYFGFGNFFTKAYNLDGSYGFLNAVFFGKYIVVKWIIWEIIPFLIFFLVSPVFITYKMQKKYAYTSADSIDLGTDFLPPVNADDIPTDGTRVIPKMGNTKVADDYDFEEISSSSGNRENLSDTKNFSLKSQDVTAVNPEDYVRTASYRDTAPLKKVARVPVKVAEKPVEHEELYRVRVLREQEERQKEELKAQAKSMDNSTEKNYSANRKF